MLGWALKKSFQSATGNKDAQHDDNTPLEGPDTPAPVFAARALKHAIFGTPAPPRDQTPATRRVDGAGSHVNGSDATWKDSRVSPPRPPGILLTPGTGTARRKRVSFEQSTKADTYNGDANALALGDNIDKSSNANGNGNGITNGNGNANNTISRKKTPLQQALENSRTTKIKPLASNTKPQMEPTNPATAPAPTKPSQPLQPAQANGQLSPPKQPIKTREPFVDEDSDYEWEDDFACSHDLTVDLNEPHSNSGKYWKSEFNKYTEEARAEMEKLVMYKHRARKFAEQKDAEAVDLIQKLQEEQAKVLQMEKRIQEMAGKMMDQRARGDGETDEEILQKLADKTALVVQYRAQVQELEELVRGEDVLDGIDFRRLRKRAIDTSPRTEKALLEVQRELRRARNETKDMHHLEKQCEALQSDLLFEKQRATKLAEENRRLAEDHVQPSYLRKVEKELQESRDENRQKADELKKFKKDHEELKENAKRHAGQARQVLDAKNARITELEREVRALKARDHRPNARPRSIDVTMIESGKMARDARSDFKPPMNRPPALEKATDQSPKRSASAEDLTLDGIALPHNIPNGVDKKPNPVLLTPKRSRPPSAWTETLREAGEKHEKEKQEHHKVYERDRAIPDDANSASPRNPVRRYSTARSMQQPVASRRTMSEVIATNTNKTSPPKNNCSARGRAPDTGRPAWAKERAVVHDVPERSAEPRTRPTSNPPYAIHGDGPGIDLMTDRYARVGAPDASTTTVLANMSSCKLPADRQAAARARLEAKKREKQLAVSRISEKEDVFV